MLRISDESYERVTEIIEDIGYCCVTEDDYTEWEDSFFFRRQLYGRAGHRAVQDDLRSPERVHRG